MSEVKVNKISPRSGTTVTLGDSGDTFTIPSGATINNQGTATNFGATGSASWNTTVKTGDFTAVAGEGYFVDTTSQEIDVTLPAGSPGAVVAVKDYAKTWDTNNCVIISNGSEKIGGSTNNAILSTEGLAVTLIYIDSTQGWLVTDDGLQSSANTNPYIVATGGAITESGNCRIHTFTGPGTFTVSKAALAAANNEVSYVVVAGGGGGGTGSNVGGQTGGGAGGAGGFRETKSPVTPYTASPLDGQPSAPNRITVTASSFPITVGGGGAGGCQTGPFSSGFEGTVGEVSTFSTITSAGGGKGGRGGPSPGGDGGNGGSGGGAGANNCTAGSGNTPPTSPAQGTNGNVGASNAGGGGGGATAAGGAASNCNGGDGGAGATSSINGTPTARAGGGGGGTFGSGEGTGGAGGGGAGGDGPSASSGTAGTVNTGGGGGGANSNSNSDPTSGGNGGSGVVIIRYRYQ
jgi:hypothetical protein